MNYQSQFSTAYTIQVAGQQYESFGFIKFSLNPGASATELVLTIPFPGQVFPNYSLNTQVSGLELHLQSSQGPMLTTESPADLLPGYAAHIDGSRFFYRIGGWEAGNGSFQEYVYPFSTVTGDVVRVDHTIPEPPSFGLAVAALLLWRATSLCAQSRMKTDA